MYTIRGHMFTKVHPYFVAFYIVRVTEDVRETILSSTKNYNEMNRCNVKPDYTVYLYVLAVINKL